MNGLYDRSDEQNPDNPDDHDGNYLLDEGFIYADRPNWAICTTCEQEIPLGQQSSQGENRAADHVAECPGPPAAQGSEGSKE